MFIIKKFISFILFLQWANESDIFLTFQTLYLEAVNFLQGPLKGFNQKVKRLLKFQRRREVCFIKTRETDCNGGEW